MHSRRRREDPLYMQIAEELREDINRGRFKDDDKLPSLKQLVQDLGVSKSTLREAIGILERDGLIKRIQGVGTLITRSKINGMERLKSFTESIKMQGMEPGTSYKKLTWENADSQLVENLNIEKGSEVAVLERVRTGDGKPMIYSIDKLHQSIVGEDFTIDKMGESLFNYLKHKRGLKISYSKLNVRATEVGKDVASYLELKPGSPVLSAEETYYNIENEPFLYCVNIYRTDRYYFQIVTRT